MKFRQSLVAIDSLFENAFFFIAVFFNFVSLVSVGAFRAPMFLIGTVTLLAGLCFLFSVRPFFDFGEHEVAVDGPDALDKKLGVQNSG